jgi:hypothetical protein
VENIIVIYLDGSEFSRQFSIVYFWPPNYECHATLPPYFHGSASVLCIYVNRCTTHYSSGSFWTRNRLDQIKVITRAHTCHHFYTCTCKKKGEMMTSTFVALLPVAKNRGKGIPEDPRWKILNLTKNSNVDHSQRSFLSKSAKWKKKSPLKCDHQLWPMKIDMNHHQRAFSPSEIKISSLDYTARIIAHQNAVFTTLQTLRKTLT